MGTNTRTQAAVKAALEAAEVPARKETPGFAEWVAARLAENRELFA